MSALIYILTILSIFKLFGNVSGQQTDSVNYNQVTFEDSCDINLEDGICLYDGSVVITPPPTIEGLIMFLTFDQSDAIDQSGNSNNANGTEGRGPGYFISRGYSAHYHGELYSEVAPSDTLNHAFDGEFSVSFWLFSNSLGTLVTEQ